MSSQANLYIHPQNQQLLWNILLKTPLFNQINTQYREHWFKNIIQLFYEKNTIIDNPQSLQLINKDTIQYMIHVLKQMNQPMEEPVKEPLYAPLSAPMSNSLQYISKAEGMERKQELTNNIFMQRQKEYEKMFEKPAVPELNFKENLDDEPISNMEELVERHRREREHELTQYAPPKIIIDNNSPTPNIKDNIPIIENEKKVRWVDETMYNKLKMEMEGLKQEINIIKGELEIFKNSLKY